MCNFLSVFVDLILFRQRVSQQLTIKQVRQYKGVTFGLGKQTIVLDFIEGEDKYGLLSLNFLKGHSFILNYKEKELEILAPSL